jgi:hypothetical protein
MKTIFLLATTLCLCAVSDADEPRAGRGEAPPTVVPTVAELEAYSAPDPRETLKT